MKPTVAYYDANDPSLNDVHEFHDFIADKTGAYHDVAIFTDRYLWHGPTTPHTTKVLWLQESPAILPGVYDAVKFHEHEYDAIFTHRLAWCADDKYHYCPPGGAWVRDWGLHEKHWLCSLIASDKSRVDGHQLRHLLAEADRKRDKPLFDLWGSGYRPSDSKEPMLRNYYYTVVIENTRSAGYFTEKLIDAILMGCVPIYWGDPLIGDTFDMDGIVVFDESTDFDFSFMCPADYNKRLPALRHNFEVARSLADGSHILWEAGLKDLL